MFLLVSVILSTVGSPWQGGLPARRPPCRGVSLPGGLLGRGVSLLGGGGPLWPSGVAFWFGGLLIRGGLP